MSKCLRECFKQAVFNKSKLISRIINKTMEFKIYEQKIWNCIIKFYGNLIIKRKL